MDFSTFQITGPATATDSVGKELFGILNGNADGKAVALTTRCR